MEKPHADVSGEFEIRIRACAQLFKQTLARRVVRVDSDSEHIFPSRLPTASSMARTATVPIPVASIRSAILWRAPTAFPTCLSRCNRRYTPPTPSADTPLLPAACEEKHSPARTGNIAFTPEALFDFLSLQVGNHIPLNFSFGGSAMIFSRRAFSASLLITFSFLSSSHIFSFPALKNGAKKDAPSRVNSAVSAPAAFFLPRHPDSICSQSARRRRSPPSLHRRAA